MREKEKLVQVWSGCTNPKERERKVVGEREGERIGERRERQASSVGKSSKLR